MMIFVLTFGTLIRPSLDDSAVSFDGIFKYGKTSDKI